MTVIEFSDEQAAALTARAAAEGLSLEEWLMSLAAEVPVSSGSVKPASDIVLEEMRKVPRELLACLPKDGASQHDHYLYGAPKKDA